MEVQQQCAKDAQQTPAENIEQPSIKIDIFYALSTLGNTAIWSILSGWLLYFYLPPEGEGTTLVPAALYGGMIFIVRTLNALIAPPIGYLSDNLRVKWGPSQLRGRRLPLMFLSALPMLVFFVLLWIPPIPSNSIWNLIYLAFILMCYNLAYTFNQIPYTALLPELALTDKHRVRISAWTSGALLVGMILGSLAGLLIETLGYASTALIYAVATVPLFYLPFAVLRERANRQTKATERLNFKESLSVMLRNRPFVIMTVTGIFYWGITSMMQAIVPYIVTEVCLLSPRDTVMFYIPAMLAALVCYPLITWLSNRLGKWKVFSGSLLASALVLPGLAFIGEWFPLPLKAQGILWMTSQAIALSAITMLPPAFGAEITDYDETLTGQRREGIYYASWGLLDQIVNGGVAALLPLLLMLGRSQMDPNGPLGVRMVGVVGGVMMLVAFLIFQRYPLREPSDMPSEESNVKMSVPA